MSQYQYYEFRALDRPLTPAEQAEVAALSSRADPHPTRATFVYHYGGGGVRSPLKLLQRYYDAFYYIANWGTTRLAFRLPASLVDVDALAPYRVEYRVEVETAGEHVILDLTRDEEDYGWTEGAGRLDALLGLRDELLRGDRRLLYLAWLSTLGRWDVDKAETEPPLPAGLGQLTAAQQAFVEEFHLDPHLVAAAAQASPPPAARQQGALVRAVDALTPAERRAWLLRLAEGEPNLDVVFRRALLGEQASAAGERTVGELLKRAKVIRRQQERAQAEAEEERRLQELEAFAPEAEKAWERAQELVDQGTAAGYDEGVALLVKLHDLAIHQETEADFAEKMQRLRERYEGRYAALHRRLDAAGLP